MNGRRGRRAAVRLYRSTCWAWLAVAALAGSTALGADGIPFKTGAVEVAPTDRSEVGEAIPLDSERAESGHMVVQFDRPVDDTGRARLEKAGIKLLRYLGSDAYFATVTTGGAEVSAATRATALRGMAPIERAWKLHPRVLSRSVPEYAVVDEKLAGEPMVGLYVLFHADVPAAGAGIDTAVQHGAIVRDVLESINGLVIEIPLTNLDALADEDVVQWIEWPLPPLGPVNNDARSRSQADTAQAAPYNLDGSGVTVLVYDGGTVRSSHVDFQGRLTVHDSSGMADHATHVAGTIGGAGVANSAYVGMAPGVTMLSYGFQYDGSGIFLYSNPGDIESDYDEAIHTYGADISNNSIGTNTAPNGFDCDITGDYGVTSSLIDTIVRGDGSNPLFTEPFRVVWANGNERQTTRCGSTYSTTAPPAGAKNHIAVGALNSNNDTMTSFSSWGPVDDGRLKPDVSASGCQSTGDGGLTSCSSSGDTAYTVKCGTSMAAPTTTGLAALVLEDYRAQFPAAADPRNSTLKILLAHTAVDVGNPGPDYQFGYGSVRVVDAIDFMRTENFREDQVSQGETYSILVSVNAGEDLKVTLAWDDYPGTPNVNPALVNDLDLRVYSPSSQQYYPWTLDPANPGNNAVRTQADHINNVEQVVVDNPTAGVWRVEVHGYSVPEGPQPFSICASPRMAACSSDGTIALDAPAYGCAATAEIQVVDCDLNTSDSTVQTVTVTIASDSEPGGESVLLTETAPETADFRGTIPLSLTNSSGVLLVAHGDTVTATYIDADDGQGGQNVTVTATAGVDCQGPVISNVQVVNIGGDTATITFDTDVPATGTVRYGTSCGALTGSKSETGASTSHAIGLTGLAGGTTYFFAVDALDQQSNSSTDDNGGSCYTFSTANVVYDFSMDSNPGWTMQGLWAYGQPTGGGGQYGGPDPTSGHTGSNVLGYNLSGDYENGLAETHLTSTALDFTGYTNVTLTFWRWLGVEQPAYDHAYVRVSNNGSTWTTLWQNTAVVTDSAWTYQEFDISAIADNQSTVYLRWTMGTTDGSWQYCGWNLDDIQLVAVGGAASCSDGILNQGEDRIDCGGPCPACECVSDVTCDDGTFCNGAESCNAYGNCQAGSDPCPGQFCDEGGDACVDCLGDGDCDDGLYCNGAETCVGGTCQAGTTVDCDDGVSCTDDTCNEATDSCDNVPNDAACNNGFYCDGVETCDALLDCQAGTAINCDDGIACTVDTCNEGTDSCDNSPDDGACDDGLFCNGAEACDAVAGCLAGMDPCVGLFCDEDADLCVECIGDGDCDDGLFCNGAETCVAGSCQAGGDPCPGQMCDETGDVCVDCINDGDCADGLYCNGIELCIGGACQAGTDVDCDDAVDCTADSCNEAADSCDNVPDDGFCDDGAFCNGAETCDAVAGCLAGSDPCPGMYCDEAGDVCVGCLGDGDCDDGLFCNGAETCVGGTCQAGTDPCPGQSCDEGGDVCVDCVDDGDCDDGVYCNGVETCVGGTCLAGTNVDCDDAIDCTIDSCNEATDSCDNTPDDGACDDGLFCNGAETCDTVAGCLAGSDPCPGMYCDEVGDVCVGCLGDGDCDDGLFCNGPETCVGGTCQAGTDPCLPEQFCNEDFDVCEDVECTIDADCDDGSDCTADTCVDGVCYNDCTSSVAAYPYGEGWEAGYGLWSDAAGDDINWTQRSGSTPSSNTGPSGAHSGTYYLYIEASSPNYPSRTAILDGPCFDLAGFGDAELTFWYHMYGTAMGSLYVEATTDCVSWTTLWSLSGNQGNSWFEASVDLTAYVGQNVVLRFRGVTGSSYTSDICIDDIAVTGTPAIPCDFDSDCEDGLFCNGAETCVDNLCQPGSEPCGGKTCDEVTDQCLAGFAEDFENGNFQGWDVYAAGSTASTGTWEFGDPVGTVSGSDQAQPEDAYAGTGCGFTAQNSALGTNDVDGGVVYFVSPPIDLDGVATAELRFFRWFYNRDLGEDSGDFFTADVSNNDGASWVNLETLGTSQSANVWTERVFDLESYVTLTGTVRLRFGAADGPAAGNIIEAAIDDLTVVATGGCQGDGDCDDGVFCNGAETCVAGSCQPGGDPCPGQMCDEGGDACVDCLVDGDCADGLYCNGAELCIGGACQAGSAIDCDDAVSCTADSCNESTDSCDNVPDDGFCDDGAFCNGAETCDAVAGCLAGSDPCPGEYCDEVDDVCVECLGDGDCDDGQFCNGAETCVGGTCQAGTDPCPGQLCDEAGDVCVDCVGDGDCADGVYCNGIELCVAGSCQAGTAVDCDDAIDCTVDSCNEGTDSCDNVPDDGYCDDGAFCNGAEFCDTGVGCLAGGDPCAGLFCDESRDLCVECFGDGDCDDGLFCNGAEACVADACEPGTDPCPGQSCDEGLDQCIAEPTGRLETGSVIAGSSYVTVNLAQSYFSPVVVCTVQYDNNSTPVVPRVSNVTATSFDVRLQLPSGGAAAAENVTYLVVEEGVWTIDGVRIEAQAYLSTVTSENNSWNDEVQAYGQSYASPVVLGQVMSENDPLWSVFWCQGNARSNPPTGTILGTGKTVCEDPVTARANELIGFVVIEAGHGTIGGVEFEAALGADTVRGVDNAPPFAYSFNTAFATTPDIALVTMAGMDGGNGGWAQLHGPSPVSVTGLQLSVDEDQVGDSERRHTTEQVGYLVFETALVYP